MRVHLLILACIFAVMFASAQQQTIPISDLKVYQIIALWDEVPKEALNYGDNPVTSFRQADYTYSQQKAYAFNPELEQVQAFADYSRAKEYVEGIDDVTFAKVESKLFLWGVHFSNKKYPNYNADITQIDIVIPLIPDNERPHTTLTFLPVNDGDISIASGKAIIVRDQLGAVVISFESNVTISLHIPYEFTSDMVDEIKQVSFVELVRPEPPKQAEPVVVAPTTEVQEVDEATSIVSIVLLCLLVLAGGVSIVLFLRIQKKKQIVAQYSSPGAAAAATSHNDFFSHINGIMHKLRKHKE